MNDKELLTHYGKAFENLMAIEDEQSGDGESTRPFQVRQDEETNEWLLEFSMPDLMQRHLTLFREYDFEVVDIYPIEETLQLRLRIVKIYRV